MISHEYILHRGTQISLLHNFHHNRNSNVQTVIFLHGFTGSAEDFRTVLTRLPACFAGIAIDLPGHGLTGSPAEHDFYSTINLISIVEEIINTFGLKKVILCGYSMGGRLALAFSAAKKDYISGLCLISTSPGIEDPLLRNSRASADKMLAEKLEAHGTFTFMQFWLDSFVYEVYKKKYPAKWEKLIESKSSNNPLGLSRMLEFFSPGIMPYYGHAVIKFDFPTLILAGDNDPKYSGIALELKNSIPGSECFILKNCGHALLLEHPRKFVYLFNKFLSIFNK